MKSLLAVAALLQVALCGHVSVRMPYLNPAGVTYIDGGLAQAPQTLSYAPGANFQPHYAQAPFAQYSAVPEVTAHHVGYAAAQVPALAAVPYVKHVPTVSQVPVTRYEAHQAVFEKQVDVVKPAVSTRKVEVRRPAIQKQFYDIEERVIIRPAGSAVVELNEPTSKVQRGPTVVQPLSVGHQSHVFAQQPFVHSTPSTLFVPSSTPAPAIESSNVPTQDDESVAVENPDFRNVHAQSAQQEQQQTGAQYSQPQYSEPQVFTRSNGAPIEQFGQRFIAHDPSPATISSQRTTPEENQSNQNKLIELLTARGSVSEVGYGRDGSAVSQIGSAENGQVRARVLSATPAPDNVEPAGERVSTRRVVVSRPIETLQEIDVVEPATKIERLNVQQPGLIKTARLEHVQVHGSVPVVGKALTPTYAHATVPLYQKTISPAYQYYHR